MDIVEIAASFLATGVPIRDQRKRPNTGASTAKSLRWPQLGWIISIPFPLIPLPFSLSCYYFLDYGPCCTHPLSASKPFLLNPARPRRCGSAKSFPVGLGGARPIMAFGALQFLIVQSPAKNDSQKVGGHHIHLVSGSPKLEWTRPTGSIGWLRVWHQGDWLPDTGEEADRWERTWEPAGPGALWHVYITMSFSVRRA